MAFIMVLVRMGRRIGEEKLAQFWGGYLEPELVSYENCLLYMRLSSNASTLGSNQ